MDADGGWAKESDELGLGGPMVVAGVLLRFALSRLWIRRRLARTRIGCMRGFEEVVIGVVGEVIHEVILDGFIEELAQTVLRGGEDGLGVAGGDGVPSDEVEGVLDDGNKVRGGEGGDEVEGFAELLVGPVDTDEFVVGPAELVAAEGELVAGLAVGEDPGTHGR